MCGEKHKISRFRSWANALDSRSFGYFDFAQYKQAQGKQCRRNQGRPLAATFGGREKKELLVAVTASAKSGSDICFNSDTNLAVWNSKAGSFVFCFRIGSGDI